MVKPLRRSCSIVVIQLGEEHVRVGIDARGRTGIPNFFIGRPRPALRQIAKSEYRYKRRTRLTRPTHSLRTDHDVRYNRHRCVVREDGKGEVVIAGLEEKEAIDADGLEALIADGNRNRTTHATESNDQSSRYWGGGLASTVTVAVMVKMDSEEGLQYICMSQG